MPDILSVCLWSLAGGGIGWFLKWLWIGLAPRKKAIELNLANLVVGVPIFTILATAAVLLTVGVVTWTSVLAFMIPLVVVLLILPVGE